MVGKTISHYAIRAKLGEGGIGEVGRCREIGVEFLTGGGLDRYLALEFPENQFPPELPELLHARTEGNALFMVDRFRYLKDRQVIARQWRRR